MAEAFSAILTLAQKLSGIGFGTMVVLILFGSYFHKWMWTRDYEDMKADYERRLVKAEERADKYEAIATRAVGLASHGVNLAEMKAKNASE